MKHSSYRTKLMLGLVIGGTCGVPQLMYGMYVQKAGAKPTAPGTAAQPGAPGNAKPAAQPAAKPAPTQADHCSECCTQKSDKPKHTSIPQAWNKFTGWADSHKPTTAIVGVFAAAWTRMCYKADTEDNSEVGKRFKRLVSPSKHKIRDAVEYAKEIAGLVWDIVDNKIVGSCGTQRGFELSGVKLVPHGGFGPWREITKPGKDGHEKELIALTHTFTHMQPYGLLGIVVAYGGAALGKLNKMKDGIEAAKYFASMCPDH